MFKVGGDLKEICLFDKFNCFFIHFWNRKIRSVMEIKTQSTSSPMKSSGFSSINVTGTKHILKELKCSDCSRQLQLLSNLNVA